MVKSTERIALGLFLLNKDNRKALDYSLKQFNCYLSSLDPNLTERQRFEMLVVGMS